MSTDAIPTREALIEAAEELFAEHGFSGVGNRAIVERAGANIASIKYHFGSKQGLYLAAIEHALEHQDKLEVWEMLREKPPSRVEAVRLLARFIRGLLAELFADAELNACAKLILREAMRPTEAITHVVDDYWRPYEELLSELLGIVAPRLDEGDSRSAVWCVLGQIYHLYIFKPFYEVGEQAGAEGALDCEPFADFLVLFSLRGLGCSERLIARALGDQQQSDSIETPS